MNKYLQVVPLVLLLCFAFACQDKAATANLEKLRTQAEAAKQNEAMFRNFTEELNKGNIEFFREVFPPEFICYDSSGVNGQFSLEELIDAFKMHFKGFPDLHFEIQEVVTTEDKIVARSTSTGTHTGEWFGIPATGNKIKIGMIEIWHMKDGKWVEIWQEYDRLGLMQQLGLELKPKVPRK